MGTSGKSIMIKSGMSKFDMIKSCETEYNMSKSNKTDSNKTVSKKTVTNMMIVSNKANTSEFYIVLQIWINKGSTPVVFLNVPLAVVKMGSSLKPSHH